MASGARFELLELLKLRDLAMSMFELGVLSDTHGLLRPEAVRALRGCDVLLHAGDVGSVEVLDRLWNLGCEHIVRGNVDRGSWAHVLPERLELELGAIRVVMVHDRSDLETAEALRDAGVDLAVFGHSHSPEVSEEHGVILLNPGSCGPRRFRLPVSVARVAIGGRGVGSDAQRSTPQIQAEILELEV